MSQIQERKMECQQKYKCVSFQSIIKELEASPTVGPFVVKRKLGQVFPKPDKGALKSTQQTCASLSGSHEDLTSTHWISFSIMAGKIYICMSTKLDNNLYQRYGQAPGVKVLKC